MKDRTLTLNGFSKAYSMTGWRVGYVHAPKKFIVPMIRVHQYTVVCATSFAQYGAEVALRAPQTCVEDMRKQFERRCQLVVNRIAEMDGLTLSEPKGAFYAFVNIKNLGLISEKISQYFLHEAGVALPPGSAFGTNGEGFIRISFVNSYENISEAMDRIERAIQKLK